MNKIKRLLIFAIFMLSTISSATAVTNYTNYTNDIYDYKETVDILQSYNQTNINVNDYLKNYYYDIINDGLLSTVGGSALKILFSPFEAVSSITTSISTGVPASLVIPTVASDVITLQNDVDYATELLSSSYDGNEQIAKDQQQNSTAIFDDERNYINQKILLRKNINKMWSAVISLFILVFEMFYLLFLLGITYLIIYVFMGLIPDILILSKKLIIGILKRGNRT